MPTTNQLGKVSLIPKGEYSSKTTYERLDVVNYNGSGYIVRQKCTGITPIEGYYYMLASAKGDTGPEGEKGERGMNGVAVASQGQWAFNINENGHLILSYVGDTAPNLFIRQNDGHLILRV